MLILVCVCVYGHVCLPAKVWLNLESGFIWKFNNNFPLRFTRRKYCYGLACCLWFGFDCVAFHMLWMRTIRCLQWPCSGGRCWDRWRWGDAARVMVFLTGALNYETATVSRTLACTGAQTCELTAHTHTHTHRRRHQKQQWNSLLPTVYYTRVRRFCNLILYLHGLADRECIDRKIWNIFLWF